MKKIFILISIVFLSFVSLANKSVKAYNVGIDLNAWYGFTYRDIFETDYKTQIELSQFEDLTLTQIFGTSLYGEGRNNLITNGNFIIKETNYNPINIKIAYGTPIYYNNNGLVFNFSSYNASYYVTTDFVNYPISTTSLGTFYLSYSLNGINGHNTNVRIARTNSQLNKIYDSGFIVMNGNYSSFSAVYVDSIGINTQVISLYGDITDNSIINYYNLLLLDLTRIFDSGNEPNVTSMDYLLKFYKAESQLEYEFITIDSYNYFYDIDGKFYPINDIFVRKPLPTEEEFLHLREMYLFYINNNYTDDIGSDNPISFLYDLTGSIINLAQISYNFISTDFCDINNFTGGVCSIVGLNKISFTAIIGGAGFVTLMALVIVKKFTPGL
jgi:hypothetical protein